MGSKRGSTGLAAATEIHLQATSDHRRGPKSRRGHALFGVVATAAVVWLVLLTGNPALPGAQVEGIPEIRMARPSETNWYALIPGPGEPLPGFPEPMVWKGDRICIGFGNPVFEPEARRPTVAQCIEPSGVRSLDTDSIATLMTRASGLDTWHFMEAAGSVEDVQVELGGGEALSLGRIYISGSTFALRLPNGRELDEIEWSTESGKWTSVPDAEAWRTSVFCPPSDKSDAET